MAPSYFPQFLKLPLELRDQIWSYAFPEPRVYEVLDSPSFAQSHAAASSRLIFADIRNEPPPILARVCRDSRQAVLRRYKPLVFSGTVKHLDLSRDIILLDSYLQVKRLLKVVRLLSQVETVRRNATRLALGTSWGLHTGLHLRVFHKTVQTRRSMAKFLQHISKLQRLETIILVVYQRSTFNLRLVLPPDRKPMLPWAHYDFCESYYFNFNVNFNFDDYWLRRPYQSKLVKYDPPAAIEPSAFAAAEEKTQQTRYTSKQQCCPHDPQPQGYQVRELKDNFEGWLKLVADSDDVCPCPPLKLPSLETATLTWIYTGVGNGSFY